MTTNDVFISYRRKDAAFVKQLAAAFTTQGHDVWVDWEDIPPGVSDFTREIGLGIEGANTFIAVLSPDFLESEYCLNELQYATDLNKRIIPIVHRPVDDRSIPEAVRTINWVYFIPHAGQSNEFPTAFKALQQAINTDYDYLREHTRLLTRARNWATADRDASFLISGAELSAAENWLVGAAQHTPPPATIHSEFILQSRQAQTRRQRRLLSGAVVLLLLALVGLVVAVLGGLEARRQQIIAERRADELLSLAAASAAEEAVAAGERFTGLRLAHFAGTFIEQPPAQVQQTLQQIAYQPGARYAFFDDVPADHSLYAGLQPGDTVRSSDQSGTYLVADDDDLLTVRNADDQILLRLHKLYRPVGFPLREYDPAIHPAVLERYADSAPPLALSPDQAFVAVGGESVFRIVSNDESAGELQILDGHTLPVDGVRYSADGRYLVSRASADTLINESRIDKEFFVWDMSTGQAIFQLDKFQRSRDLFAIAEDGVHLLFIEDSPPGYTLWDVRDSRLLVNFAGSFGPVMEVSFTPDGDHLIAASVATLRMRPPREYKVYDLAGNLINQFGGIESNHIIDAPLLFSPDGTAAYIIDNDGRIIETDVLTGAETVIGSLPNTNVEGKSANGQFVAIRDYENDGMIIWDLQTGEALTNFSAADIGFTSLISNDGRFVASSIFNDNGLAELVVYDLAVGAAATWFEDYAGESGFVGAIAFAFSPDSEQLLYVDNQSNVRVVQTGTWEIQTLMRGVPGRVSDLKMSTDQRLIAVAGEAGTVVVWDADTGSLLQRLEGAGAVSKLSIAPDGTTLLTGDERGQIRLWRLSGTGDVLTWLADNRALMPITCDDLLQAIVIVSLATCPL